MSRHLPAEFVCGHTWRVVPHGCPRSCSRLLFAVCSCCWGPRRARLFSITGGSTASGTRTAIVHFGSVQPPPFGKSALRLPLHAACSAAPVSIRRPRSRVPRLGTRLGGLRLAVLRCVRPHCRAGVVPVPFRQRGKIAQVVLAMTWFTDNYITRYGMTQSYQAEADLRCAGTTRK